METNKWKSIWNNKSIVSKADNAEDEFKRFCELKKANGFDVAVENEEAYFQAFYKGWIDFYNTAVRLIGADIHSVFEVGCGSGVNLYMFKNRIPDGVFGGCDYSETMIKSAGIATGCDNFSCCGADQIAEDEKYDIVMAESVFQYFESQDYAERVLRKMIQKSGKMTYLGEIHNKVYEQELMEYRRKTIKDYDERYKGLSKLFLSKEWITEIAGEYGKKVVFTEINNPEYLNGKYEYNCFIV